jgi:aconitate hydratase
LANGVSPREQVAVRVQRADGSEIAFNALARIDSPLEAEQYRHGGILPYIMRRLLRSA